MELYQAYTDYYGMMDLTENMYRYIAQELFLGTTTISYPTGVSRWIWANRLNVSQW